MPDLAVVKVSQAGIATMESQDVLADTTAACSNVLIRFVQSGFRSHWRTKTTLGFCFCRHFYPIK